MRFRFVDRIISFDSGRSIETLKNVANTEDIFDDHFPGYPILPGALVVETFEQASQLLIASTYEFARVGRLDGVQRAAFRHFVRPGDQLKVRCARTKGNDAAWTISATGEVDGRRVATATLEFSLVDDQAHAERLRETVRVLRASPIEMAGPA
jgi:3-hydroxyacyl-[acyl-carrier-protein] dehydratase